MEELKLPDSELKVMDVLWEHEETTAREAAEKMADRYGWKKNTTYTVLKNLQNKGAIERIEPGFICRTLISREQTGRSEARNVLQRFYKGSATAMFSAFLADKTISKQELEEIKALIDRSE